MNEKDYIAIVTGVCGAILGITALSWRIFDEIRSYLRSSISTTVLKSGVMIQVTIENKSLKRKKISKAFLVVNENRKFSFQLIETLVKNKGHHLPISSTEDIEKINPELFEDGYFDDHGNGIISLPFFYRENYYVADETLAYKTFFSKDQFSVGKLYSVRFYLFENRTLPITNFRNNHDLFIFEE